MNTMISGLKEFQQLTKFLAVLQLFILHCILFQFTYQVPKLPKTSITPVQYAGASAFEENENDGDDSENEELLPTNLVFLIIAAIFSAVFLQRIIFNFKTPFASPRISDRFARHFNTPPPAFLF